MKISFKQINRAHAVGLTLLLASCASTIDPQYALTSDEMNTMKQAQFAHTADGAMKGAVVGAASGAAISALSGGDKKDIQQSAVTGGVTGGLLGGFAGFQKGDQAGKNMVNQKRTRQVIEKEIAQKTASLRKLTATAERQIILLRSAQQAGQSPDAIKKQAQKVLREYEKGVDSNSYQSDYKGLAGDKKFQASYKEASELKVILQNVVKDGNVQKS